MDAGGLSGTQLIGLKTTFVLAKELLESTNPGEAADLGVGPTFDGLLEAAQEYVGARVRAVADPPVSPTTRSHFPPAKVELPLLPQCHPFEPWDYFVF